MEFKLLTDGGIAPLAALRAATSDAAELLGLGDSTGAIAVGLSADLVAVPGDPAEDASRLRHANFVMRAGTIYRRDNHAVARD